MKQDFALVWNKMWQQHKKTKDALNVFAYAKKDSQALKKESGDYEQLNQKMLSQINQMRKTLLKRSTGWINIRTDVICANTNFLLSRRSINRRKVCISFYSMDCYVVDYRSDSDSGDVLNAPYFTATDRKYGRFSGCFCLRK